MERRYKDLIIAKNNRDLIEYYFTLSPFLPKYIFEKFKCTNIAYVDSDFFFFKNPIELFQQTLNNSVTLIKQETDPKYGIFNMGLIHYNFNFKMEGFHQLVRTKSILWSKNQLFNREYLYFL